MALPPEGPQPSTTGSQRQQVAITLIGGGEQIHGSINTLNPQLRDFFVHQANGQARRLSFTEVKCVAFVRPKVRSSNPVFPAAARLLTVRFMDGSFVQGIVQAQPGEHQGIFLVPTGQDDIEKMFIPLSAIREMVSVQKLGEILTEQRMATREMVEAALKRQAELREENLGAILLRQHLIEDRQLAEGLSLQKQRTGRRIGEILVEQGFITDQELELALDVQRQQRSKKLGTVMIEMGYASHKMLGIALSIQFNIPFVSLALHPLDPKVRDLVPAKFVRLWSVVPFSLHDDILAVALVDPSELAFKSDLRVLTGLVTTEVIVTPQDLARAIERYYPE